MSLFPTTRINAIARICRTRAISLTGLTALTLFLAISSGAAAQDRIEATPTQLLDLIEPVAPPTATPDDVAPTATASLDDLVDQQAADPDLSPELTCLAGAVYFEAKSESLAGQLAVGRVIVARTRSGRFPTSYCGVVYQHAQFSFIRGGAMPDIRRDTAGWRHAVAIARIADIGSWQSPTEGALFFHAARVRPAWRLTKVAQVDNHIFYR